MSEDIILGLGSEAIKTALLLGAPILISTMIVGIVISVLQAVTQINEATLTFIPKILTVVVVLAVMAPWMLQLIQDYATYVIGHVGEWVR